MPNYSTDNEISSLVAAFESGTIPREAWGHSEHLIVANHYLSENDFDAALVKMRAGIFNLLRAFEIDLSKEMPYHETLTVFWMQTVEEFRKSKNGYSEVDICNMLIENFDKDHPLKFYSRELLFSDDARRIFVEGELGTF